MNYSRYILIPEDTKLTCFFLPDVMLRAQMMAHHLTDYKPECISDLSLASIFTIKALISNLSHRNAKTPWPLIAEGKKFMLCSEREKCRVLNSADPFPRSLLTMVATWGRHLLDLSRFWRQSAVLVVPSILTVSVYCLLAEWHVLLVNFPSS